MATQKPVQWFWGIPPSLWAKAATVGLGAGIVMMAYQMLSSMAVGKGFFLPLNIVGATVPAYRPPLPAFSLVPTLGGLGIHLAMSAIWGLVYGLLAARVAPGEAQKFPMAFLFGMGLGVVAWIFSGMLISPWVDPVIHMQDPVVFAVGHLIFGVLTALGTSLWARDRELRYLSVTFAPEELESITQKRSEGKGLW